MQKETDSNADSCVSSIDYQNQFHYIDNKLQKVLKLVYEVRSDVEQTV